MLARFRVSKSRQILSLSTKWRLKEDEVENEINEVENEVENEINEVEDEVEDEVVQHIKKQTKGKKKRRSTVIPSGLRRKK